MFLFFFSFERLSGQLGQALNASSHGWSSWLIHCKEIMTPTVSVPWCSSLMSECIGHLLIKCFIHFFFLSLPSIFFFFIGRALDFSREIDAFTGSNRDLRSLKLDPAEWEAITLVSNWLKAFRSATTEMLTTKKPMLSTVHTIYRSLEDHVKTILETLPDTAQSQLHNGLVAVHQKLSEYYYWSDESPYYTWAASAYQFYEFIILFNWLIISTWSLYHVWRSWKGFCNRSWPSQSPCHIQTMASNILQHKLHPSFSPVSQLPKLINVNYFVFPTKGQLYFKVSKKIMLSSMSFMNILNFLEKTLIHVSLLIGGEVTAHNFLLYISLSVIFSQFLVSHAFICYSVCT